MYFFSKRINIILPLVVLLLAYQLVHTNTAGKSQNQTEIQDTSVAGVFFLKGEQYFNNSYYDSALYCLHFASPIFKANKIWRLYIKCILLEADIHRIRSEFDIATKFLTEAENAAFQYFDENDIIFSNLFHLKGTIYSDKGDFDNSIMFLKKSIDIRQKINGLNDTELSHSYNYIGNNYFFIGDYFKALEYYKKALNIALLKENEIDPDIAIYNQNIGIIYATRGDFDQAMAYFKKSLDINKQILSADDPALAQIYFNIGRLSNLTGKYDEAIAYYNSAKTIYINKFSKNHPKLGRLYLDEGSIYYENREYDKSLNYYFNSLYIFLQNYNEDHPDILKVYNNIGNIYYQQKEYNKALEYYLKIIDKKRNPVSTVITARNLANCYNELGFTEKAEKYYKFAIEKCRSDIEPDHPELANSYLVYGSYCIQTGEYDKALKLFRDSYKIFFTKFGPKNPDVAKSLLHIGNYHYATNDFQKAIEYYHKSIIALVEDFNEKDVYKNPGLNHILIEYYLLNSLVKKAEAFESFYLTTLNIRDLEAELETYGFAIRLIDKIRTSYQTQESKLFLTDNVRNTFIKTIRTNLQIYNKTKERKYKEAAFKYAEKSKSSVLLASVRDFEAKLSGGIPDSLQKLEKDIQSKIVVYDNHVYDEKLKKNPDQDKIHLWEGKLFEFKQQLDQLVNQLETSYPKYYKLKYDNDVIDLSVVQKKLAQKALIEYTMSDSLLFIFIIRKDYFDIIEKQIDANFYKYIDDIRASVKSNDFASHSSSNFKEYATAAYQLYKILLAPIDTLIKGKELIIIPDDKLGYIPFESLITRFPDTSRMDYRKLNYLIKDYLINYSYSATLLFDESFAYKRKSNKKLLAFAPTYQNKDEINSNTFIVSRGLDDYLIPIPGVYEEINNIKDLIKADTYEGTEASEKNFKLNCKNYDILHLAMHTIIDDQNPMYSRLVFTINNKDTVEDGFLNTYEIYNMNLTARLAVLSACNTGTGLLHRGEGIMSLARGFLYAGVPGIVMTLWSVEDKSGVDIMTGFYRYLRKGYSKNEALRMSKLDYLTNANAIKAHPYFWSAYVNIGDTSALRSSFHSLNKPFIIISIMVLTGIIVLVIISRLKRQKPDKSGFLGV